MIAVRIAELFITNPTSVIFSLQAAHGDGVICRVLKDFDQGVKDGEPKSSPEVVKLVAEKKKALVILLL